MTFRSSRPLLAGLLALWLPAFGCSSDPEAVTQITITVESDLDVPDEIDGIAIDVTGLVMRRSAHADLSQQALPRHLTLVHEGGPLGPITITARGMLGNTNVVTRSVQASFERGAQVEVEIVLQRACVEVTCPESATCDDGTCVSIEDGEPIEHQEDGGSDASTADDGGDGDAGNDDAGDTDSGTDSGPIDNQPPRCTITEPSADQVFTAGLSSALQGTCEDPEDGSVTAGLTWSSDRDGQLGTGESPNIVLLALGDHQITLCAPDPSDAGSIGCTNTNVSVSLPEPPTASIDSVTQSGSASQPFRTSPAIAFESSTSGQMIAPGWTDSFIGSFGSAASQVSLMSPVIGRHTVTLTVDDNVGQSATDSVSFVVLGPGQTQLVQPLELANNMLALANNARIEAMASDSMGHALLAPATSRIYTISATTVAPSPSLVVDGQPLTDDVRSLLISESEDIVYISTRDGFVVCDYQASSGLDDQACTSFRDGDLPDNDVSSVVRVRSDGDEYLVVGTAAGLLRMDANGRNTGQNNTETALEERNVVALGARNGRVWVATHDDGLYSYNPAENRAEAQDGEPTGALSALVVDSLGMVWVGSQNGVGRYNPQNDSWLILHPDALPEPGLASDQVRCLAVSRASIGGVMRDVIWVGTDSGVSRVDASIPSIMNLTMADGLPSNSIRAITVLSDGSKLIATDSGVARYVGP